MKTCPKCGGRVTTFSPDLDWCASCEARYQPGEIPDVDPKANEIEQLQAENTRLQSKLTHACEEGKKLQAENVRLQAKCDGYAKENEEVMQHLGQALGYPYFADDQKNFPGATKADGVAVGEHVPVTLAIVAKKKIEQLSKTEAARNT